MTRPTAVLRQAIKQSTTVRSASTSTSSSSSSSSSAPPPPPSARQQKQDELYQSMIDKVQHRRAQRHTGTLHTLSIPLFPILFPNRSSLLLACNSRSILSIRIYPEPGNDLSTSSRFTSTTNSRFLDYFSPRRSWRSPRTLTFYHSPFLSPSRIRYEIRYQLYRPTTDFTGIEESRSSSERSSRERWKSLVCWIIERY